MCGLTHLSTRFCKRSAIFPCQTLPKTQTDYNFNGNNLKWRGHTKTGGTVPNQYIQAHTQIDANGIRYKVKWKAKGKLKRKRNSLLFIGHFSSIWCLKALEWKAAYILCALHLWAFCELFVDICDIFVDTRKTLCALLGDTMWTMTLVTWNLIHRPRCPHSSPLSSCTCLLSLRIHQILCFSLKLSTRVSQLPHLHSQQQNCTSLLLWCVHPYHIIAGESKVENDVMTTRAPVQPAVCRVLHPNREQFGRISPFVRAPFLASWLRICVCFDVCQPGGMAISNFMEFSFELICIRFCCAPAHINGFIFIFAFELDSINVREPGGWGAGAGHVFRMRLLPGKRFHFPGKSSSPWLPHTQTHARTRTNRHIARTYSHK